MSYVPMIDHSAWQWPGYNSTTGQVRTPIARPDFSKAADLGVAGIKARACNGLRPDPTFPISNEATVDAGLVAGAYQYLRPDKGSGRQNAEVFASIVNAAPHTPSFLVADAEGSAEGLGVAQFVDWFGEWGDTLRRLTGRFVLRYSADWWWNPEAGPSHGDYDTIIASYPGHPAVPPSDTSQWQAWAFGKRPGGPRLMQGEDHWDGWQFTSSLNAIDFGYPAGGTSRLDGNLIRADSWARWTARLDIPDFPAPDVVGVDPPVVVAPPPTSQEFDMSNFVQLAKPARFYDSRDPQGPNRLKAGEPRPIYTGHPEAAVAFLHAEAVEASGSGSLVFWNGDGGRPNATSVGIFGGYGQSAVVAPVGGNAAWEPGYVWVQSSVDTHLVLDLQAFLVKPADG